MINLHKIAKAFDDVQVLKDISFNIKQGEKVSLVGPGGCGKTIILKILLGLLEASEGTAELMGRSVFNSTPEERSKVMLGVGMAFQQGGLFDFMTVEENLLFAMEHMTTKSKEEMTLIIDKLLQGVKLTRTKYMYPHELSGGMKRRVGIARALCTSPKVAIFDEPTSGLDPVTSSIILNMILELSAHNSDAALLVSTSNVEIAVRFAERIIVVNDGVVVADGNWKDLLLNSSPWVKNFLGVRFIGLDLSYAHELNLPQEFIDLHWN